jgi:hypothetical protein
LLRTARNQSLVLIYVGLSACAPSITSLDTSCPQFKDVRFSSDQLTTQRIAILPVQGIQSKEQFRTPLGRSLSQSCISNFGQSSVVTSDEVAKLLSENNLVGTYANGLRDYRTTGILATEYVQSMAEATGCRFALYTNILPEQDNVVIASNQYGTATNKVSIVELSAEVQIWDLQNGGIVWEGKGGYAYNSNREQINSEQLTDNVNKGLMNVLGREKSENCPDRIQLVQAEKMAYAKTLLGFAGVSGLASFLIFLSGN